MNRENSIANNRRVWDKEHPWPQDGDEWSGQAAFCGQPYDAWKQALVDHFIAPRLRDDATVLEIGPGHGRWTRFLAGHCKHLYLADLSQSCLDHCRDLFGESVVDYVLTDGRSLAGIPDGCVDFVWSYDCFVHIAPDDAAGYLRDIRRVLKPGGEGVIHHPGRRHASLPLAPLRQRGDFGAKFYTWISMGNWSSDDGWRSAMSRQRFAGLARATGLEVTRQQQTFGPDDAFAVRRFGDWITTLRRAP
ncbi:MAG TPA: class I SAM-dependent methyltransferase [Gammaproteobacteria bacterium]|nr:class I SAM-dependent methyltransferase [Gammaproteobacteria bacterium]